MNLKAKDAGEFADFITNMLLCYYLHAGKQEDALRSCAYRFSKRTLSPIVAKVAFAIGVSKDPLTELQKRLDLIIRSGLSIEEYLRIGIEYGQLGERKCALHYL